MWYLMAPPRIYRGGRALAGLDVAAPVGSWQVSFSFENAGDCEKTRETLIELGRKLLKDAPPDAPTRLDDTPDTNRWNAGYGHLYGICVASDDPRLKRRDDPGARGN